jgi:hypothetical protein
MWKVTAVNLFTPIFGQGYIHNKNVKNTNAVHFNRINSFASRFRSSPLREEEKKENPIRFVVPHNPLLSVKKKKRKKKDKTVDLSSRRAQRGSSFRLFIHSFSYYVERLRTGAYYCELYAPQETNSLHIMIHKAIRRTPSGSIPHRRTRWSCHVEKVASWT